MRGGGQPGQPTFPEVRVFFPTATRSTSAPILVAGEQVEPGHPAAVRRRDTGQGAAHVLSFGTQNEFYKFYNLFS